jgi:hypothetical protein
MSKNRRPDTPGAQGPSRKQKPKNFLSQYYNKPADLAMLKKIAREEQNRLVRIIASGFADRLERQGRSG